MNGWPETGSISVLPESRYRVACDACPMVLWVRSRDVAIEDARDHATFRSHAEQKLHRVTITREEWTGAISALAPERSEA